MKGRCRMEREQNPSQYSMDIIMDLIFLIRCAISRTKPDVTRVSRMDQQKLYVLAFRHSLAALVGTALAGISTGDMGKRWQTTFSMAVRKTVLFDAERKDLVDPEDRAKNMGIRLVYRMAKDIRHQNILGLNVLTIRI